MNCAPAFFRLKYARRWCILNVRRETVWAHRRAFGAAALNSFGHERGHIRKVVRTVDGPIGFDTQQFKPISEGINTAEGILLRVYQALRTKGYDPITQIVGYLMSGDPTYITSYDNARSLICRVERDEIIEELVRAYVREVEK